MLRSRVATPPAPRTQVTPAASPSLPLLAPPPSPAVPRPGDDLILEDVDVHDVHNFSSQGIYGAFEEQVLQHDELKAGTSRPSRLHSLAL